MNGIGASLEVLQPFVDALDRAAHGRSGSTSRASAARLGPSSPTTWRPSAPSSPGCSTKLGFDGPGRRPRAVLGRGAGPALRRPAPETGAGGSCSPPPRRDRSWCPPTRGSWPGCSPRGDTGTPSTRAASPVRSTAARCAPTPSAAAQVLHADDPARARGAATTSSWPPAPAGAACRSCKLIRQPTLLVAGDDDPIVPVGERADHGAAAARRPAAPLRAAGTSR